MTQEEQRIAIGKTCGWTHYHEDLWVPTNTTDFSELDCTDLPDYLSDLNAMHEAEKTCLTNSRLEETYYFAIDRNPFATASQRAEAFLRTLNLWKD